MNTLLQSLKERFERATGCRIYRYTLPHGVDCYLDLDRRFGRKNFKVVFDVGANEGSSAATYLHEFPEAEIHSFEPVAKTYRQLVDATKGSSRVHPHPCGMAREPGSAIIHVNPLSSVSSIPLVREGDVEETIQLETVAGFAEKSGIDTIDFMKVDTEGYDLEVLAGAVPLLEKQKIHFILTECEPVVRTQSFVPFPAIAEFLGRYGYRVFGVYEQQPEWDGNNVLFYWNALFISEKLIARGTPLR